MAGSIVFFAFYDQWFSTFFLLLVVLLPVLSLLCSLPAMLGFRLELDAPPAVELGEAAKLTLRTRAPLPLPRFKLRLWVSHSFSADREMPPKAVVPLPTKHCGALTITAEKIRRYDYLGLFALPLRQNMQLETLVRPRPVVPEQIPDLGQLQSPVLVPRPMGTFSEIHELRTYRPGDSLRTIHWKASAKTEELVVREPMEPENGGLLLTAELCGTAEELDELLGKLLWLSTFLLEHELTHEFRILTENGVFSRQISTPEQRDAALDGLLRCTPAASGTPKTVGLSAQWQRHSSVQP